MRWSLDKELNHWYLERYIQSRDGWSVVKRIKPYKTEHEAQAKAERLNNMTGELFIYRAVWLDQLPVKKRQEQQEFEGRRHGFR